MTASEHQHERDAVFGLCDCEVPVAADCARCGWQPARGHATINGRPYCHDDDRRPSCYELAQWADALARIHSALLLDGPQ